MARLNDRNLRRFWFPVPGHLGIGVTAYSPAEAEALARDVATHMGWTFEANGVMEDVDVRQLDQNHVVPNMGPVTFHGVWYPMLNLGARIRE
jgi:hypothetical protein